MQSDEQYEDNFTPGLYEGWIDSNIVQKKSYDSTN